MDNNRHNPEEYQPGPVGREVFNRRLEGMGEDMVFDEPDRESPERSLETEIDINLLQKGDFVVIPNQGRPHEKIKLENYSRIRKIDKHGKRISLWNFVTDPEHLQRIIHQLYKDAVENDRTGKSAEKDQELEDSYFNRVIDEYPNQAFKDEVEKTLSFRDVQQSPEIISPKEPININSDTLNSQIRDLARWWKKEGYEYVTEVLQPQIQDDPNTRHGNGEAEFEMKHLRQINTAMNRYFKELSAFFNYKRLGNTDVVTPEGVPDIEPQQPTNVDLMKEYKPVSHSAILADGYKKIVGGIDTTMRYIKGLKHRRPNQPKKDSIDEELLIESGIGLFTPEPTSEKNRTSIEQLKILESEDLSPADKRRIIRETPKQAYANSCVFASLSAIESTLFMKDIDSPTTLEKARIDLATKRGLYAKKSGINQQNTETLLTKDLKYKVFHPQDGTELLEMLKSGDKGAIMFVQHEDERNHTVVIHVDKKTGKLIIGDPDSNRNLTPEDRTTILSATEKNIKKLITNKAGDSTLGNVLVVGDVNSKWEQPEKNGQEKDQSIVNPEDWLTEKEKQINEQVSRLKTGRKQELDIAFKEAKLHIDESVLLWTESQLNEFYDQHHRPQAETLKGQLKKDYNRGLKNAFNTDFKRAIVSLYRLGQAKKAAFGDSNDPEGSPGQRTALQEYINEETRWATGEHSIGDRKLSQVSTILELMHPQTAEQTMRDKTVENAIQKAVNTVEQLRAIDETEAEEDFILEIVQSGIMHENYSQDFIDLIDRWLEKDNDNAAERNIKNRLQRQFENKFESIVVKSPPQKKIRKMEDLIQSHHSDDEVENKIRDILRRYKISNSRLERTDKLATESIDSITNALMAGLKISEINKLNSTGVFEASDTEKKTRLRKQLLRAAIDYVTVANKAEEHVMNLSEYAELTDEDKERLYMVISTSDLSTGMSIGDPRLQSRLQELGEKMSSAEKIREKGGFQFDETANNTLKETEHRISVIQNGIIEYVQQNIDSLANLHRDPEEVKKMGGDNFVSKIIGIYIDRLSENIKNPPAEFGEDQKNKLNELRNKLQSNLNKDSGLVFDAQRKALGKISTLKDTKRRMDFITTNPYLKHLRGSEAARDISYSENVDVIAREEGGTEKPNGESKSDTLSAKPKKELKQAREDLYRLYEQESVYNKADLMAALKESLTTVNDYSFEDGDWEIIFKGLISHDNDKRKHVMDKLKIGLETSQISQLKKVINKWHTEKARLYKSPSEIDELVKPKDEDKGDEAGSAGLRAA